MNQAASGRGHLGDGSVCSCNGSRVGRTLVGEQANWVVGPEEDRVAQNAIHGRPVFQVVMANDNHPSRASGLALTVAAQAIGARNATATAVVGIGSGVHALLSTNRLFRRTDQTRAAQAYAGCADVVAAATVLVVGVQVHALFVAVNQWLCALKGAGVVPTRVGLGCVAGASGIGVATNDRA